MSEVANVRWVSAPDDYTAASTAVAPGDPVPVLLPDRPEQAAAWRSTVDRLYARVRTPGVPGERVVLAWGADAADGARTYANMTAARLVLCEDVADVCAAVRTGAEQNAVVVAPAALLTVAAVSRISAAAAEAGVAVGFLCGRQLAALSFSVAKALLDVTAGAAGVELFDAPSHRAEENPYTAPAALSAALRETSLIKILRSHGEGGHAKYGGVVVCGLLDPVEFPDAPGQGCTRHPRVCKRAEPSGAEVVFGDEVAAPVVIFLCCNGFNVANELYPSPVSMALAFAEGQVGAVIAPARPLVVPDAMLTTLREDLARGLPLGQVVAELNRICAGLGQPDAFVLIGDPCLTLPGEHAPPATESSAEAATGDSAARDSARIEELRDWLVLVLRHAARGRRLLRSARSWLGGRAPELLEPPSSRFEHVERLTLYALKWLETHPGGEALRKLGRTTTMIRLGVARWDAEVARLLLQVRDTADAFDIGHYDLVLADVAEGAPCLRCGTPLEVHTYGRGEPDESHRTGYLCRVCGPVAESGSAGPALTVRDIPKVVRGGDGLTLSADLRFPATPRIAVAAQVYLRFFDKARDRCVHEEVRTVLAEDQRVEFDIALPADLGVDLHSIRLAAVSGFDIAYARARVAALPGTESPDGSRDHAPVGAVHR